MGLPGEKCGCDVDFVLMGYGTSGDLLGYQDVVDQSKLERSVDLQHLKPISSCCRLVG